MQNDEREGAKRRELQQKAEAYTASAGFPAAHDNLKISTQWDEIAS